VRRATAVSAVLLCASAALTACSGPAAPPPETDKTRLTYVVVPHPDDELQAWALLEQARHDYPVFILLTRGEASSYCAGGGLQAYQGEVAPDPQPFGQPGSDRCKDNRVASFNASLDELADLDPYLDRPPLVGTFPAGGRAPSRYELRAGSKSARIIFDLGDGTLLGPGATYASTVAAIDYVRTLRGTHLPEIAEHAIVGAAYYNNDDARSVKYTSTDHRAVHAALWHHDFGTPGPQLARTTSGDPRASLIKAMSPSTYQAAMALGPDLQRRGIYQRNYGWLAFNGPDGPNGAWPLADTDTDTGATPFTRIQSFWSRH